MKRVLVSESLCGGGCREPHPPASLVREGRAMLEAVLADFCRVADADIWTTWDRRLGEHQLPAKAHVVEVDGPEDERRSWQELIGRMTDVLLIAPESDGVLAERAEFCERHGCRLLGPSSEAIRLCGDKWETFRFLDLHGIPTIETRLFSRGCIDHPIGRNGFVLKPRDGAGSQGMRFVARVDEIERGYKSLQRNDKNDTDYLLQPFVAGMPLSCSVLIGTAGDVDIFPIGRQILCAENSFAYEGGETPVAAGLNDAAEAAIQRMIRKVCHLISGLRGYVGFDLILPEDVPADPLTVEINPRLTTSYLGYRQLTETNLAERMLDNDYRFEPIRWHLGQTIRFSLD